VSPTRSSRLSHENQYTVFHRAFFVNQKAVLDSPCADDFYASPRTCRGVTWVAWFGPCFLEVRFGVQNHMQAVSQNYIGNFHQYFHLRGPIPDAIRVLFSLRCCCKARLAGSSSCARGEMLRPFNARASVTFTSSLVHWPRQPTRVDRELKGHLVFIFLRLALHCLLSPLCILPSTVESNGHPDRLATCECSHSCTR
jgi:hypothetical protein